MYNLLINDAVIKDANVMTSPLEKGVTYAEQAVAADNANDLERAYCLYLLCLEWLNHARKYAATPNAASHIASAMLPRMERAEELHAELYGQGARKRSSEPPVVRQTQFQQDGDELKASLASAIISERPATRLSDVAGLDEAKQSLREAVLVPMQAPQLLEGRVSPWTGILLYGPPGTGKTYLAKAIAGEAGCTIFCVSASDLINKYVGQSERLVRALFEMARAAKPAIIFIDEVESIVPVRGGSDGGTSGSNHMDRVVTEFLAQVDGADVDNKGILVLAATNIPWQIDTAALRRFERHIYIPLPEPDARAKMIAPDLLRAGAEPAQIIDLVAATEGYSGSDIKNILKSGDMRCLRRVLDAAHFCPSPTEQGAFIPCPATVTGAIQSTYDEWPNKGALRCPPTTTQDYLDAMQVAKPTVHGVALERFTVWAKTK